MGTIRERNHHGPPITVLDIDPDEQPSRTRPEAGEPIGDYPIFFA
jgi:hypothetical protein